jgi:RNA recognition motif-containing protein
MTILPIVFFSEKDESQLESESSSVKRKHQHLQSEDVSLDSTPKKKNSQTFKVKKEHKPSKLEGKSLETQPKKKQPECANSKSETNPTSKTKHPKKKSRKRYYIVFVGNLSYLSTETEIAEHFLHIGLFILFILW